MIFDRWDVALAPFPFAELPISKLRPILILSGNEFHGGHDVVIAAMITTAARGRWPSDHPILDLAGTGLKRPCVVRFKLASLSVDLVGRQLGALAEIDRYPLMAKLAAILPFSNAEDVLTPNRR